MPAEPALRPAQPERRGISAAFRQGLSERGLLRAAGISKVQNVHATTVELRWPKTAPGRPRGHPALGKVPVPAEMALASATWRLSGGSCPMAWCRWR